MYDIFLSYSRTDTARAQGILRTLQSLGLKVFFDTEVIAIGESFPERLDIAIRQSLAVLALYSPAALESPWCRKEWITAQGMGKLIPSAIAPITSHELGILGDASYADLINPTDEIPGRDWHAVLSAIALKLDAQAENEDDHQVSDSLFDKSSNLKRAARRLRPKDITAPSSTGKVGAAAIWERLKNSRDVEELEVFAAQFPSTEEAYNAALKARQIKKENDAFAALDGSSSDIIARFMKNWPNHPRYRDANVMLDNARVHEQTAKEQAEKTRKAKLAAEESQLTEQIRSEAKERQREYFILFSLSLASVYPATFLTSSQIYGLMGELLNVTVDIELEYSHSILGGTVILSLFFALFFIFKSALIFKSAIMIALAPYLFILLVSIWFLIFGMETMGFYRFEYIFQRVLPSLALNALLTYATLWCWSRFRKECGIVIRSKNKI